MVEHSPSNPDRQQLRTCCSRAYKGWRKRLHLQRFIHTSDTESKGLLLEADPSKISLATDAFPSFFSSPEVFFQTKSWCWFLSSANNPGEGESWEALSSLGSRSWILVGWVAKGPEWMWVTEAQV